MYRTKGTIAILAVVMTLLGCQREGIRVYDAPKEVRAARMSLPEGWEELPPNQMAIGNYVVRGKEGAKAQITVSALPPSDELANVNRWRRQVGLEPTTMEELGKQVEAVQVAGHSAAMVDMAGTPPESGKKTRIVAALAILGDSMWFFKMMGDDDLVAAQKGAFTKFLASYPVPAHDHSAEQGTPPVDAPPAGATTPTEPKPASSWKAPAGWVEQQAGAMQDARFSVGNGKAVVTLSIFGNAAGDLRGNIDRWRGQIGLDPINDVELGKVAMPLDLPDAKATLVDMTGGKQRLIAVIVPRGERTWYFKLMGEPETVGTEKTRLVEFVKTTK